MNPVYIISSSCISPQKTFETDSFLANENIISTDKNVMYCAEPDFKKFINPVQIRRMSRALKIGFSAAMDCLSRSSVKDIDAIIIGTGKGCLVDTEEFLHSIKQYNETALNPTHFIHSTYNQLNGMIAMSKKINSYNVTYAHRGFSFEHTIIDGALLFDENEANHILVGSFDEMTAEHFNVKNVWGYWKQECVESKNLLLSETAGTIAGEGSSFYILSNKKTEEKQVEIKAVKTLYNPERRDIASAVEEILEDNKLTYSEIDILMRGNNGNVHQKHYDELFAELFPKTTSLYFKHLCGEFDTASQFAFWVSTQILVQQHIPDSLYHPLAIRRYDRAGIKHILLYNNYFELNHSLILLSV